METIKTMHAPVHVCFTKHELGSSAARDFVNIGTKAIAERGRFTVGLSGGSTPPLLYEALAGEFKGALDWNKVHFWMSDERCVPVHDKDSNWGMAVRDLFDKLNISEFNLHPMQFQDTDPKKCAADYQRQLQIFFQPPAGEFPRFDLIQLGMGPDGHTASLFPGSKALEEKTKWVTENFVDKFETFRVTFTFPMLNAAEHIMFMVQGEEKSHVLAEVMQSETMQYPVQFISPDHGTAVWYVDEPAAHDLLASAHK